MWCVCVRERGREEEGEREREREQKLSHNVYKIYTINPALEGAAMCTGSISHVGYVNGS